MKQRYQEISKLVKQLKRVAGEDVLMILVDTNGTKEVQLKSSDSLKNIPGEAEIKSFKYDSKYFRSSKVVNGIDFFSLDKKEGENVRYG